MQRLAREREELERHRTQAALRHELEQSLGRRRLDRLMAEVRAILERLFPRTLAWEVGRLLITPRDEWPTVKDPAGLASRSSIDLGFRSDPEQISAAVRVESLATG
jgi:hypothetical protein